MNVRADNNAILPLPSIGKPLLALAAVMALCLGIIFYSGLSLMVQWWIDREEYSYGWFVPPIAVFLVWQKRDALHAIEFEESWSGVTLILLGLATWLLGELSALYTIVQYAFLLTLAGAVLATTGWRAFRAVGMALFILVLMIPLPDFVNFNLSQKLQLLSSEIGVGFMRLVGISVYLEGNVIDLGDYKLQVAEACSGLRYLFPLMTLGFVVALFFRAPFWQRALLFVSTAPITVLMNSFRIGVVGVLVNEWGSGQAEGFMHYFEGWIIFMACLALLAVEMWLMLRLSGTRRNLRDALAIELPARIPPGVSRAPRPIPRSAWAAAGLLALGVIPALTIPDRVEAIPKHTDFAEFPATLGNWSGRTDRLEKEYIDELKFTDYELANYTRPSGDLINLYIAYYESQRKGQSVHSPRACLPGGGWVMEKFEQHTLPDVVVGGRPLTVNRVLITKGNEHQLVYYWFQQRGRLLTNEYLVKWFLFWDSLTRNRTDGSLVRLVAPLAPGVPEGHADQALTDFARTLEPGLPRYLPD